MIVFPNNMRMRRIIAFIFGEGPKLPIRPVALFILSLCFLCFVLPARAAQTGSVAGGWIDLDSGTSFFSTPEALCGSGAVSYEAGDQITCSNDWRKYGVLAYACPPGYLPSGYPSQTWEMQPLGGVASGFGVAEDGVVYLGVGRSGICESPGRPKVIAIDPGHGFNCPSKNMPVGAIGVTDFPTNDPPAGKLREDELTVAIAREVQRALPSSKYKVVLTKKDANSCPSYRDRGRTANNANAEVFVSVHINAPNPIPGNPFWNGTSALYNSAKAASKTLADLMAGAVSSSLGVNNRGSMVDDELAVLKPRVTTMNAVVVEAARLSGSDEIKLHTGGSTARVAAGIKAALDAFLGN